MTFQLTLPPDLEERLRSESERQGLPPDAVARKLLDEHLPAAERPASLPALFAQWQAEDESAPSSGPEDEFFQTLDAARTSHRKLFPPELKGISW
jgi:hypothetical protein